MTQANSVEEDLLSTGNDESVPEDENLSAVNPVQTMRLEAVPADDLPINVVRVDALPIDTMRVEVRARRWTMRVIALLLAGQAAIIITIIWVTVATFNWQLHFRAVMLSMTVMDTVLLGGLLVPMAVFDLVTAMGLWIGQRSAWLRAMIAQGILLIFCLSSYVAHRGERYIYLLMLTCIVLVLYLNTYDVRLSFNSRESKNTTRSR